MTQTKAEPKFSRRSFIKGAAAAAAGAASAASLVACQPEEPLADTSAEPETVIRTGVCRSNCMNGCVLDLHIRDGKLVRTTAHEMPDPDYQRICPKGLTQPARVYSAERLQYPMRRTGERGEGLFERITWDEAVEEIVAKWKENAEKFGPNSNALFYHSGNMSIVGGNGFCNTSQRFAQVLGFSTIGMDTDMAGFTVVSKMCGNISPVMSNNEWKDFSNSKTFVCWGFNPAVSLKQSMHFILKAQESGTRFIVIDPVYNTNASKADWFVPVNPSTDGALALAMIHEIVANGMEDREFVRAHTEAPLLVKEDGGLLRMSDLGVDPTEGPVDPVTGEPTIVDSYAVWDEATSQAVALEEAQMPALSGVSEVNGIAVKTEWDVLVESVADWSPETSAPICGISPEDIRELARVYAEDGPVNTYMQYGCNHYFNAPYNYWPIDALCVITGNTGKPGAAFGMFAIMGTHLANSAAVFGATDSEGNPAQGAGPEYTMNRIGDIIDTGKFGDADAVLKSVFIRAGNPVCTFAGHNDMVEWIKKIDVVVVAEVTMTETAMYADILLPASYWFETTDLFTSHYGLPYSVYQKAALEPLYESKPDFEILKLLAEAMGYGDFFNFTEEEYMALWLNSDAAKELGITVERLQEETVVRNLPGDNYISFEGGQFLTPTGRAKLYDEAPVPLYNYGQEFDASKERKLYWEPALEADKGSIVRDRYPFQVISEHMRTRTHTQWWDVGYMRELESGPVVRINPQDAADLGIVEGDMVRLYNDRGAVTLPATLCAGYPRKVVGCPRSFQAKEFIDGHLGSLSTQQYNQGCPNAIHNDVAVAIEKA